MSTTLHLDEPLPDDRSSIDCEEVRILGELAWGTTDDGEVVVPLSNVTGVEGDVVEQFVEDIESPGGRYTEIVTDVA